MWPKVRFLMVGLFGLGSLACKPTSPGQNKSSGLKGSKGIPYTVLSRQTTPGTPLKSQLELKSAGGVIKGCSIDNCARTLIPGEGTEELSCEAEGPDYICEVPGKIPPCQLRLSPSCPS